MRDMKFFYTYVLLSLKDHKLYIGYTNNIKKRLKKHLEAKVSSTRNRLPLELIYYEACLLKESAINISLIFFLGYFLRLPACRQAGKISFFYEKISSSINFIKFLQKSSAVFRTKKH